MKRNGFSVLVFAGVVLLIKAMLWAGGIYIAVKVARWAWGS